MTSEPIISVSGLRGIIGDSFTPMVAARYAAAFASTMAAGKIIVTRDGRESGELLAQVICGTLRAAGHHVIYADIAATPTTGILIQQFQASGGIQISASHNPIEYNGLKLFGSAGRVVSGDRGAEVLQRYHDEAYRWSPPDAIGGFQSVTAAHSEHLSRLLRLVDVAAIREQQYAVVLDANHGAGSLLGRPLLEQLGCRVTILGEHPDGKFAHPPEPTAGHLQQVANQVRELQADIGFCQDPDADRLALIDEQGRYVGEELTVALCVQHVLSQQPGTVVTNCSTSRMTEDLAQQFGVPFFRSKVGEANVCDLMIEQQAVFGGEGNGGPIDPRIGYVRDSFVGMVLVLEAMAQQHCKLSELASQLPQYAMEKSKAEVMPERLPNALAMLKRHFSSAQIDELDGVRFDWPGRWLLVRSSNTEPIVRFVAEARELDAARQLCREAADIVAGCQ